MSSSCLSSGGAYHRLEALDLDIIKSPSSTSWISNSSSPSSTLSDSSNCARAISTRKPRTPRKRPNQTYNEAAAILSTAYPKIFPTAAASNKFPSYNTFLFEPSDLLMPFHQVDILDSRLLLLDRPAPTKFEGVVTQPCQSPPPDEFDAGSILDEEIGGGIESIIGDLQMEKEEKECDEFCYGYPVGLGVGYGLRRAMRSGDDWWRLPCVNVVDVNPNNNVETKKKKKVEITKAEEADAGGLHLNLNYDGVLRAWSDKPSPFSGDSEARGRLAQIDLFGESGGVREASVLRYKEKRRTRLFSKKIRYQVRKLNADRRPRMKGRFVRTPTSSDD